MSDLKTLLEASIELAKLRRELGKVKLERDLLRDQIAAYRAGISDFDVAADSLPALLRPQA